MKLGLRAKLLLPILFAILIGMSVSALLSYSKFTGSLRELISSEMSHDVALSAKHIDLWLQDRKRDVAAWADDEALLLAIKDSGYVSKRARETSRQRLQDLRRDYPFLDDILLLNRDGLVVLASKENGLVGQSLADHPHFVAALTGKVSLSEPHTHTTTGKRAPIVGIAAPVPDRLEETVPGVLIGVISLEAISDLFVLNAEEGTQLLIVDAKGRVVGDKRPARLLTATIADTEHGRRILAGRSGQIEYEENSTDWIAAYEEIPTAGWTLVRTRSLDAAYAPARAAGIHLIVAALVVVLVVALIVVAAISGATRAVRVLVTDARELASGNLEVEIACERNDEIGELADSLRSVVQSFHETAMICQNVADGDFGHTAKVRGPHDRLGRAINQMASMLRDAVDQANAVAHGNFDTPIEPRSERDSLRRALRDMTERLQSVSRANERQVWMKTGLADLADAMRDKQRVGPLLDDVIRQLAKYTKSQIGAVYLTTETGDLQRAAAYAGGPVANMPDRIAMGEGLVGQAAQDRTSRLIEDVPPDYIKAVSGLGESSPKAVVIIPLVYRDELTGVLELAALKGFSEAALELLDDAGEDIASAIHAVHSREQLHELLERSQAQGEELQAQQEELREANEELEARARAMAESEERLQAQQEELQEAYDRLKQRADESGNHRSD